MEKKMETTNSRLGLYRGYMGIMEKKMETTIVYWDYTGGIWEQWKRKWKLL